MFAFIGLLLLSRFILMCMWVLYLTDIFLVLLCESEGVTWFALNETKTTRKVLSLAAHRKKEKENRNGTTAQSPSIWACRSLDSMQLIDFESGAFCLVSLAALWAGWYFTLPHQRIPMIPYLGKHRN